MICLNTIPLSHNNNNKKQRMPKGKTKQYPKVFI